MATSGGPGGDGGDGWLPSAVDGAGKALYLDNAKARQIQRDAKNERDMRRAYEAAERYRKRSQTHARRAGSPEPMKKPVTVVEFQLNFNPNMPLNPLPVRKGDPSEVDRYFKRVEQGSSWEATQPTMQEVPESVRFETAYYDQIPGGDRRRNSRNWRDRQDYWYYEGQNTVPEVPRIYHGPQMGMDYRVLPSLGLPSLQHGTIHGTYQGAGPYN